MLTVVAANEKGGIFTPAILRTELGGAEVFALKNRAAVKKLKKAGVKRAVLAPSALRFALPRAKPVTADAKSCLPLLPRVLAAKTELPLDELFLAVPAAEAAEIIELCADCSRLFTVISAEELKSDVFDRLYFNKGIILRRISSTGSRVGRRALCLTDGARPPLGVEAFYLNKLGSVGLYGELDPLREIGIVPTAALYLMAGLPLPSSGAVREGGENFFLDTEDIL